MPGGRLPTMARAMREYAQLDSGTRHVHLRTGRIFSTGQLAALAALAGRHRSVIFADEVHHDMISGCMPIARQDCKDHARRYPLPGVVRPRLLGPAPRREVLGHRPVGLSVIADYPLGTGDSTGGDVLLIRLRVWPN